MTNSYLLVFDESCKAQNEHTLSFIGGVPRLPATQELPICKLCGAPQTFFFQVTFPSDHFWGGLSMAVFACTSRAHEDYAIPEMISEPLRGAVIPEPFLETYQRNFRVLVFESQDGVLRHDYTEKVKFQAWKLVQVSPDEASGKADKVGGEPTWPLDDEAPGSYGGVPLGFLMQLGEEYTFETVPTAPPQILLDIRFKPKPHPWYELFLRNNLYFFGTCDRKNPHVYILTQI